MGQERVNQRSGRPPGAGMDDESRRLVQDQQVVVLVEDLEGNRFGREGQGFGGWDRQRHTVAGFDRVPRLLRVVRDADGPRLDQGVHPGARETADAGHEDIQALPGIRRIDEELAQVGHWIFTPSVVRRQPCAREPTVTGLPS